MVYSPIKRSIDILGSICGIVLLSPLLLVVMLILWFENKGTIIYRSQRIGKNGEKFTLYKFRSMIINADKVGPWFTTTNDRRITPIGGFLRKSSIDELPQLFNVLEGNMSLVGPRPNAPQQVLGYSDEEFQLRCLIRPGLTGLAQVNGRSQLSAEQRKILDLHYVKHYSFLMDAVIIIRTVFQVLLHKGSN